MIDHVEGLPSFEGDLFSDGGIAEPYDSYATIRQLGPVVALPAQGMAAVGRYADVKKLLLDHRRFGSSSGVALNDAVNEMARGTTLASDAPVHTLLRGIVGAPLLPDAIKELRGQISQAADDLIRSLAARKTFDGIADLARFLPVSIVSNLVGLPEDGRENMLEWAAATFDCMGPANSRFAVAMPKLGEMIAYTVERAGPDRVKPGSWAARIYAAAAEGKVSLQQVPALLLDYLGPSLDTTIFATGHLLHQLGSNPDQWELLREDASLVPNAIEETIRLESPIRGFTRLTSEDVEIDGTGVAAGTRLLLLYASANRDERKWHDPERFDVSRVNAREHLGFGKGRHVCAGQHLARLEMTSLLEAMLLHFRSLEAFDPVLDPNNLLRGFRSISIRVRSN